MSNTRSSGQPLFPIADPEALLRTAKAERRREKLLAISTNSTIHVPSPAAKTLPSTSLNVTSASHPSTSFHTPNTSLPPNPPSQTFTPSLLLNNNMSDLNNAINTLLPSDTNPPKTGGAAGTKGTTLPSSKTAGKNAVADHYVELLLKLQHTAALQLQEEREHNFKERRADRERIARLENTLFDVVTKAEADKQDRLTPPPKSIRIDLQKFRIADGPHYKGPFQAIEPFLKWIQQLQIFFSTKSVIHDDDKIYVAGGLLEDTMLVGFYASEGALYAGTTWDEFKSRLFEVALPQR
ncbi:hypothetical protein Pst134EB_029788 [Puccinia striiformis f. sp. tritici]|nr:hypothetical protein Pst134EB_029788 [Puccinia striiformis f. sp. tritici]